MTDFDKIKEFHMCALITSISKLKDRQQDMNSKKYFLPE